MSVERTQKDSPTVHIENIGGIDRKSLQLSPGITALVGENATNRTSLLQAIGVALGVDMRVLKSDADAGEVTLEVAGDTVRRTLHRENGTVRIDGEAYVSEPRVAELFALLFRSNDIRTAVRDGHELRDLILEPVDTDAIERRIASCLDERREIDAELDRLDSLEEELVELQSERHDRRQKLEDVTAELEQKQEELQRHEADLSQDRSDVEATLEKRLSDLNSTQSELERVTNNRESEQKRLESLEESYDTLEQQLESLSEPAEDDVSRLETRIEELRNQRRSVESVIQELRQVIRFNDDHLSESNETLDRELGTEDSQSLTAQLDSSGGETVCWTCGSQVEQSSIEEMLETLRTLHQEKVAEKKELTDEIESLSEELTSLEDRRTEIQETETKLSEFETDIEETRENIETFQTRETELRDHIEQLEAEIEELRVSQHDELFDRQKAVSDLLASKERLEAELETLENRIADVEDELTTREELAERRDELSVELDDLRNRIDRIETDTIAEFNEHIATLIDKLDYENLERVWMEQTEVEATNGRRKVSESKFELHVVRENTNREAYEDTVSHLSESEREIVGLVVALAGYIVHDVQEEVPFMLLDSVEMIDGRRLADTVSYLEEFVPYLVVVLLPDHARTFERYPPSENYSSIPI